MQNKKRELPFFYLGSSLLLVVFLVLCLVIFSVLSLSTARSDYDFSRKLASRQTAYYLACNTAEDVLHALASQRDLSADAEALAAAAENELRHQGVLIPIQVSGSCLAWDVPIDERQALSVRAELTSDGWELRSWQVVNTAAWEAGDTRQLLQ